MLQHFIRAQCCHLEPRAPYKNFFNIHLNEVLLLAKVALDLLVQVVETLLDLAAGVDGDHFSQLLLVEVQLKGKEKYFVICFILRL